MALQIFQAIAVEDVAFIFGLARMEVEVLVEVEVEVEASEVEEAVDI